MFAYTLKTLKPVKTLKPGHFICSFGLTDKNQPIHQNFEYVEAIHFNKLQATRLHRTKITFKMSFAAQPRSAAEKIRNAIAHIVSRVMNSAKRNCFLDRHTYQIIYHNC